VAELDVIAVDVTDDVGRSLGQCELGREPGDFGESRIEAGVLPRERLKQGKVSIDRVDVPARCLVPHRALPVR